MYTVDQIVNLASDIYTDIGSPTSLSVGFISGWLIDSGNLGDINNKLYTSFYLTGNAPVITDNCGNFGPEEAAIYELMYKNNFYQNQSLAVLAGGGSFWTSLSEGDTKVSRTDVVKISAAYIALHEVVHKELRLAIADYMRRISVPQSVDSDQPYAFPSP